MRGKRTIFNPEKNTQIIWAPQKGSQVAFLSCPFFEVLYHGTRGPGKTDALLMSFAMHVGSGIGEAWRGVLFRQTYPQLADVIAKSERWFYRIFPKARFNSQKMCWIFPDGEILFFRHFNNPRDYWKYHGHEYPWIGWEELTNWSTAECYLSMFSCCRSASKNAPRMIRATTNPYGIGHNWVKERFCLGGAWKNTRIIQDKKETRVAIHGHLSENKILLSADPDYPEKIRQAASNPAQADAWLDGSWDIISGGMFSDVWDSEIHVIQPFLIPLNWRIDRSFDWGSSAPFSVGWWAESDGSDYVDLNGKRHSTIRGDLFRIREWYGCGKKLNTGLNLLAREISQGIREIEKKAGIEGRVSDGPADTSIFNVENGNSIARDMQRTIYFSDGKKSEGIYWMRADKRPGSRILGWEHMRARLINSKPKAGAREFAGLFIFDHCTHFLRTIPVLSRCEKNPDDIDPQSEDHIADETRYRIMSSGVKVVSANIIGAY